MFVFFFFFPLRFQRISIYSTCVELVTARWGPLLDRRQEWRQCGVWGREEPSHPPLKTLKHTVNAGKICEIDGPKKKSCTIDAEKSMQKKSTQKNAERSLQLNAALTFFLPGRRRHTQRQLASSLDHQLRRRLPGAAARARSFARHGVPGHLPRRSHSYYLYRRAVRQQGRRLRVSATARRRAVWRGVHAAAADECGPLVLGGGHVSILD